ncbi:Ig-like domain-containing protein [Mycobacterium sp. CVI_P3]|uniref:Ig-like domain-containing protein n=1 Tax=Mycobacterium pinniadriaticum TaxID=2994102 RepID=A0ABT3SKD2_9MYCO|nr:Ig-like domain-containing protein [Mycobacterium pinniadriaticum]MCX2933519.1 Ig-like domain-containing protein [Mycobacterium pinniadriaticum]MCX2939980.1 Ig-like domain-containing protein [Mycobacterium pinniadriaticum]
MSWSRRARGACLGVVLAVLAVLGGVVVSTAPRCPEHCRTEAAALSPRPAPSPDPASVTLTPADGATDVDPLGGIRVVATSGLLTHVTMVNDADKSVPGVVTPDFKTWKPTVPLGYGRTYTLTVDARGPGGVPSTMSSTFQTLVPSDQTEVYLTTPGGHPLDGGRFGIGTVVVAHFDEPITDRAAAERHLSVTTDPPVRGSWYWFDDQNAHWRPEKYYAPGTSVTVKADVYGVPLGDGLYGEEDSAATFTIGDAHLSVADDTTKQVSVYDNGALVRTMPTSMGRGGSETIGAQTLTFWTPPGIYTVMDKANPVVMDSSTYGLPINSRLGYRETIPYATRISPDGIYLHQLNATVWAQGNTDTSHGCLNLSGENAEWFYDFSVPGDVVEVRNTGGPPLQLTENGDWTLPWSEWLKGSALH